MTAQAAIEFTYSDADVPTSTKTGGTVAEPNPHEAVVKALYEDLRDNGTVKAKTFAIPAEGKDEKTVQAEVQKHLRWLRIVGDNTIVDGKPAFSTRTKTQPSSRKVGSGKTEKTVPVTEVTFWIHSTEVDGKRVPARITRTTK